VIKPSSSGGAEIDSASNQSSPAESIETLADFKEDFRTGIVGDVAVAFNRKFERMF